MKLLINIILLATVISCGKDEKVRTVYRDQNQRNLESNAITDKYGELIVKTGSESYIAQNVPWSSWWFPSREKFIFSDNDNLSPLSKYDKLMRREFNQETYAAYYEKTKLYNPNTANWSGLCHAWAVASVLHEEPKYRKSVRGIDFSVGDQKALLLKSYENVSGLKIFGDRYDGDMNDNYEDIYPDQLHKFIQAFIRDQKKPFLMDYDPSYPVWTVPVYKAKIKITTESETSVLGTMWLTYASPLVDSPNYTGTKNVTKTYRYRLTGRYYGNEFAVNGGEWIKESISDHPDYVIEFPTTAKRGTFNKQFNIELADKMLKFK